MTKPATQSATLVAGDPRACARRVIAAESAGLQALADSLDDHFTRLVQRILDLRGRVIVSGMGKSGHIARKIAATLASTGTPALFVHPGEASHGDLGMITAADLVLCLSNSGETAELSDIIAYTRRFAIPLAGWVGRAPSTLSQAADFCCVLPAVDEASVIGAPTTSTTMMLALGDALAIALLEARGFGKDDFGVFHPGGKLGAQLLRVDALMHRGEAMPLVTQNAAMAEVLLTMTAKHFGCAGVTDARGTLIGIVTDGDLRRHMGPQLMQSALSQVMTPAPVTIAPHALAAEALAIMNARSITALFVVAQEMPVGIVHIHDCLRAGVA